MAAQVNLPAEIWQKIIQIAVVELDIRLGLRLRLVSKLFDDYIVELVPSKIHTPRDSDRSRWGELTRQRGPSRKALGCHSPRIITEVLLRTSHKDAQNSPFALLPLLQYVVRCIVDRLALATDVDRADIRRTLCQSFARNPQLHLGRSAKRLQYLKNPQNALLLGLCAAGHEDYLVDLLSDSDAHTDFGRRHFTGRCFNMTLYANQPGATAILFQFLDAETLRTKVSSEIAHIVAYDKFSASDMAQARLCLQGRSLKDIFDNLHFEKAPALCYAAQYNRVDLFRLAYAKPSHISPSQHPESLSTQTDLSPSLQRAILFFAVRNGSVQIADELILLNPDLDVALCSLYGAPKGPRGWTLLEIAAFNGQTEMITWLFDHDASFSFSTRNSKTDSCLYLAALRGHMKIMHYLLDQGARVEDVYQSELRLIIRAGQMDAIKLLFQGGYKISTYPGRVAERKFFPDSTVTISEEANREAATCGVDSLALLIAQADRCYVPHCRKHNNGHYANGYRRRRTYPRAVGKKAQVSS